MVTNDDFRGLETVDKAKWTSGKQIRCANVNGAPRASGLDGPESARCAAIARQFYEACKEICVL